MQPAPWRVVRSRPETHDTFTMTLEPVEAGPPFAFEPGQFNMLFAPGVGEAAISMSGCAGTVKQVVHTLRAVGRLTKTLQRLKRGDVLGLRGPFGAPWPVSQAEGHDVLIAAGGIGLVPLRPAVCHILKHRERFGRVNLLFGARSPRDILFAKEIETWRGRFDVHAVSSTRALVFDGKCLRGKFSSDPELGYELMQRFSQVILRRLEAMSIQLLDLYGDHYGEHE